MIIAFSAPFLSNAANILTPDDVVPCGKGSAIDVAQNQTDANNLDRQKACDFNGLVKLIQNITTGLVILSIPIATVIFAWVGWTVLFAQGSEEKRKDAKKMAWNVLIGFIFILLAYALVKFITGILLKDEYNIFIKKT
jgi:hypothetical protein